MVRLDNNTSNGEINGLVSHFPPKNADCFISKSGAIDNRSSESSLVVSNSPETSPVVNNCPKTAPIINNALKSSSVVNGSPKSSKFLIKHRKILRSHKHEEFQTAKFKSDKKVRMDPLGGEEEEKFVIKSKRGSLSSLSSNSGKVNHVFTENKKSKRGTNGMC